MNKTPNTSRESVPQIPMESTEALLRELNAIVARCAGREENCDSACRNVTPDYCTDLNACADLFRSNPKWEVQMHRTFVPQGWQCRIWTSPNGKSTTGDAEELAIAICLAFVAVMEASRSVPSPTDALTASGVLAKPEEKEDLGIKEPLSETDPKRLMESLRQAYRALDAIERIVCDDWCSDLEMRTLNENLTGDAKIMEEKISLIYRIAHSESPNHSCHQHHGEWRRVKDAVLNPNQGTDVPK